MSTAAQSKAKKKASSKKPLSHPPFAVMIAEAIASLKERTGSSQYAITKFIEGNHKELPPTFKKLILVHLKKSVAAGKLVKVKNSFKLAPTKPASASASAPAPAAIKSVFKPKAVSKPTAKPSTKPKSAAPKKKAVVKPKAKAVAAAAKPKAKLKPAKAVVVKKVAAKPAKKTPVKKPKSVVKKPKSVKSPAKKAKK